MTIFDKVKELKRIIEIMPELKERAMRFENAYLKQLSDNIGREENGFIYHVQPTVYENYLCTKKDLEDHDKRRWDLIYELGLSYDINGIPDFGESNIKPYGLSEDEKYKMEQRLNYNSPIGLP